MSERRAEDDVLSTPAYVGQTYTICLCPRCGQFLGYPGWNSKCSVHATRGDRVQVVITGEEWINSEPVAGFHPPRPVGTS
jgi:hypothetical protein